MAQLRILCAEQWVWPSTMMLSAVHQNSMWLMTMPRDLLLVLQNARYARMQKQKNKMCGCFHNVAVREFVLNLL